MIWPSLACLAFDMSSKVADVGLAHLAGLIRSLSAPHVCVTRHRYAVG
jgi:hypothetical protein